jgi:hypothetical protein
VCYCCCCCFFSLLLSHVHFGDRSAFVNTEEIPPSALSGLCFQFSPPPLIRSVGLLLKSFWTDPLSNETYFCSSFVVNTSRLVSGPFFVVV